MKTATEKLFEEFRAKLKADRAHFGQGGHIVVSSETGPVGFALVESLFKIVISQQGEIERLKKAAGIAD